MARDPGESMCIESVEMYAIAFGLVRSLNGIIDWGEPVVFVYPNNVTHRFILSDSSDGHDAS